MKILLIGNPHFKKAFELLGHRVVSVTGQKGEMIDVNRYACDLILVHESLGNRQLPHGIEKAAVPTVFYSIDVHLNLYWHKAYARLFDYVFVSQKDYLDRFDHDHVFWLPWSVDTEIFKDYGLQRDKDITFIGTVDRQRVKRNNILSELKKHFNVHLYGTDPGNRLSKQEMTKIYSQSKIVLNESIAGEVTFRSFEATACGAMLLSEKVNNGLGDLFEEGTDLVTYTCDDLLSKAAYYLEHDEQRRQVALCGMHRTQGFHNTVRRAQKLLDVVAQNDLQKRITDKETVMTAYGKALYHAGIRFDGHRERRMKRAEIIFKNLLRENAGNIDAAVFLCLIHAFRKEFDQGLAVVHQLPGDRKTHFRLKCIWGFLLLESGKTDAAIKCFNGLGLRKCRDVENLLVAIGDWYRDNGDLCDFGAVRENPVPVNALECYLAAQTPEAMEKSGELFFVNGAFVDARNVFERILAEEPDNLKAKRRIEQSCRNLFDFDTTAGRGAGNNV